MNLDDYLNRLRTGLRRLPAAQRDAVVEEVRAHLQDEAADLQARDPTLAPDDALASAIDRFGTPEEVAAGYDEQTGEVRTPSSGGQVALRVTKAVGRGAGKAALGLGKVVGIGVLVVLGGAFLVAVAALFLAGDVVDTFQDDIRESVPRPLYGYDQTWQEPTDAEVDVKTESFDVNAGTKEFHISLDIASESGCARILLVDPDGVTRYDSDSVCNGDISGRGLVFSAQGRWTLQYSYTAFTGSVDVEAWYFQEA